MTTETITDHEILLLLPDWSLPVKDTDYATPEDFGYGFKASEEDKTHYISNNVQRTIYHNSDLPKVTTCLTTWYKWVWPVLESNGWSSFGFDGLGEANIWCDMTQDCEDGRQVMQLGKTLMEALVKASKEALE